MSSLSNQQPGSPFSEYSELCKVPSLSPAAPPQTWDWQRPTGVDMGSPVGLVVGGGPLTSAGLTDEDKLCFFEQPGRSGRDSDLKVPGRVGGISGSTSLGNTSLGSAAESPDSPPSSSPSPSPASPGRLPSSLGCGGSGRVALPPVPGSPARRTDPSSPARSVPARPAGASLMAMSPPDAESPSELWKNSHFEESGPKVAMPQVAPNYCVIGVVNDGLLERGPEVIASVGAALSSRRLSEGSSGDNSEEEEDEIEEEDLEPCFMGRAEQQRKAMRRAMSECSHLSVPTSLELPDKYPAGDGDQLPSPLSGPRRSPHSMKRSLTVAEDQSPTPAPTLSAAGATHIDLRLAPPEPRLSLSPLPPLKDPAGCPLSPPNVQTEDFKAQKETSGIVLPVPLSPKGDPTSVSLGAVKEVQGVKVDSTPPGGKDLHFRAGSVTAMMGDFDDGDLDTGSYASLGSLPSTNPFVSVDGRWTRDRTLSQISKERNTRCFSENTAARGRPISMKCDVSGGC